MKNMAYILLLCYVVLFICLGVWFYNSYETAATMDPLIAFAVFIAGTGVLAILLAMIIWLYFIITRAPGKYFKVKLTIIGALLLTFLIILFYPYKHEVKPVEWGINSKN
jgi:hypothetical protein